MIDLNADTTDLVWDEIYPNVIVYRNMLKDPLASYEVMRRSEAESDGNFYFSKWDPWAQFGTYSQPKDAIDLEKAEKNNIFKDEESLDKEIAEAYYKAVSHYAKYTNTEFPESARFGGRSYCKYFNEIDDLNNNMTMQYHTDFIQSQKAMPGEKFFITCTFYINDNYNGGDIEFFVNGEIINHKPKAGDLVVFPSGEPYYHGVKTIPDGNKFFVRNFIMFDHDGDPEWLADQKRFGAYKFSKMEAERIAYEDPRSMIYLQDDKRLSYDEYIGEIGELGEY